MITDILINDGKCGGMVFTCLQAISVSIVLRHHPLHRGSCGFMAGTQYRPIVLTLQIIPGMSIWLLSDMDLVSAIPSMHPTILQLPILQSGLWLEHHAESDANEYFTICERMETACYQRKRYRPQRITYDRVYFNQEVAKLLLAAKQR
jgi:hypothetical protein